MTDEALKLAREAGLVIGDISDEDKYRFVRVDGVDEFLRLISLAREPLEKRVAELTDSLAGQAWTLRDITERAERAEAELKGADNALEAVNAQCEAAEARVKELEKRMRALAQEQAYLILKATTDADNWQEKAEAAEAAIMCLKLAVKESSK